MRVFVDAAPYKLESALPFNRDWLTRSGESDDEKLVAHITGKGVVENEREAIDWRVVWSAYSHGAELEFAEEGRLSDRARRCCEDLEERFCIHFGELIVDEVADRRITIGCTSCVVDRFAGARVEHLDAIDQRRCTIEDGLIVHPHVQRSLAPTSADGGFALPEEVGVYGV
jgi:hypothetical protein